MFSLCAECRNEQFKKGNYNITTNAVTNKTTVSITLCQDCVKRNIGAGEIFDTRIPLETNDLSKTYFTPGEIASLKQKYKRSSGFENQCSIPDEKTIRSPTTPKQRHVPRECLPAPQQKKVRRIIESEDEEDAF
uniref:Uncharacterized protein n=1 Tax=Panagrolaimus davidi TaxID=227884 RepID=A0A914R4E8_9BILA